MVTRIVDGYFIKGQLSNMLKITLLADDIVICSESKERLEHKLESWRYALERRGMKVNRRKTEYMCVNERQVHGTVKMQGEEVAKVEDFK